MSAPESTPADLADALESHLRERQAQRLPSVAAAVVRDGGTIWSSAVGLADDASGQEATPETQYRVGSITKVFTALAVLQLRDAGELDLDDRLGEHLPGVANGSPTLRRMLAHLSGLQREAGEMFVSGVSPTIDEIIGSMGAYELVLPQARAHHYSNLAFALLGEVVARRSGIPYTRYVDERVIAPLGLRRTTWVEQAPRAQGYLVEEYAGTLIREPHSDMGGVSAMGQLWSTVGDLARLAVFLATGGEGVLDPATLDEMWSPQVIVNPDEWVVGWGLGLELHNRAGRVFGGHGGAMPGFLAGLYVNRATGIGATVLTNSGTRAATKELALDLATTTIDLWPAAPQPWRPEAEPPADVREILGRWWSEGAEIVLVWREGRLTAEIPGSPSWVRPSVFEALADGSYRVESGRERGERLRRDGERLIWGGYPLSRTQERSPG